LLQPCVDRVIRTISRMNLWSSAMRMSAISVASSLTLLSSPLQASAPAHRLRHKVHTRYRPEARSPALPASRNELPPTRRERGDRRSHGTARGPWLVRPPEGGGLSRRGRPRREALPCDQVFTERLGGTQAHRAFFVAPMRRGRKRRGEPVREQRRPACRSGGSRSSTRRCARASSSRTPT